MKLIAMALGDAGIGGGIIKKRVGIAGLHRLGFIDQRKMRKYDALCLEPIPDYDSEKIRSLRVRYKIRQEVLTSLLNTSTSAVR
jgi:putative transcriptional regulator